jgi:hypothetical protein
MYKYFQMLKLTNFFISKDLLTEAQSLLPKIDSRVALNQPVGRFFYDPWCLKEEYKDTVWDKILSSLNLDKGEARLIKLSPGECYPSHADIDDRWHLTITGNRSYLIDLENEIMYQPNKIGYWYEMNAGIRHTAANVGSEDRIQLVVRKLLPDVKIKDSVKVIITLKSVITDRRFVFDDVLSPWLNKAHKENIVSDFKGEDFKASFTLERSHLQELENITKKYFVVSII